MKENTEKQKTFISSAAEQLAIKDTIASLRVLVPLAALLSIVLIITWIFNATGDRTAIGSAFYLCGYVYMLFACLAVNICLRNYAKDTIKYRNTIYHIQMTYAWMLPVWAAVLSFLDAINASHTFGIQFYVIADILTMGICYMDWRKWTLIQCVTGAVMLSAGVIMPMEDHFTFVSELAAYIVISILAGRILFTIKINSYERQSQLSEFINKSSYDPLTGVYTREAFYRKAKELMENDPDTAYTLIVSDIDNFKQINSIYGNEKGNEVLCYLAQEYRQYGKITARLGSDQFITIFPSSEKMTKEGLYDVITAIAQKAPVGNLTVKYGYYDIGSEKIAMSIMCDRALLAVKSIRRNYTKLVASYDGPVSQNELRAKKYASDFETAIANKEFVMWFQPKVDPYQEKTVAAEALIRWQKPDGNILSPAAFMDIYEENGQIIELDEFVFRSVCRQQKIWIDGCKTIMPISINLSRKSMDRPDLVQVYKNIVEETGIPIKAVPIEITETTAVRSTAIRPIVEKLHEAGFDVHLDDFGSGQSSVSALNILRTDVVKLDKSLIDTIGDERGDIILESMLELIGKLGIRTVAEGVENEEQLAFLKKYRVDEIQGYYYSKPLPSDIFENKELK